jgi:lysophospholipase L1-like esterase
VLVLVGVVTLCVATYGGFRVARHLGALQSSAVAAPLPVFTSQCIGAPVAYTLPTHPIVLFGDSITQGYGATYDCLPLKLRSTLPESAHRVHAGDTSYAGDVARIEHKAILSYGVSKETTRDGLPRLQALVRSVHPSTVVILEGINDLWGGRTTSDIVGNLSQMARSAQASGARPLIMTVLPVDRPVFPGVQSKVVALDTAIRAMGKHQNVQIIDTAARFLNHRPLSTLFRHSDGREDGVHPNDAGYRVLALLVANALH